MFDDVDVERAVPIIVRAIVQNAGQTCTAGSRLLVQRAMYDSFVGRVAEAFAKVRVGTPAMDLDCGPLMNSAQHQPLSMKKYPLKSISYDFKATGCDRQPDGVRH